MVTDEHLRRTRRWTTLILGCFDLAVGIHTYLTHGAFVAIGVVISFGGFFVMAWLVYLRLIGRL